MTTGFLEIMGGVQTVYTSTLLPPQKILWIMTALCFSGISCLIHAFYQAGLWRIVFWQNDDLKRYRIWQECHTFRIKKAVCSDIRRHGGSE